MADGHGPIPDMKMVPGVGIEPTSRLRRQRILSPPRLPVPPPRHGYRRMCPKIRPHPHVVDYTTGGDKPSGSGLSLSRFRYQVGGDGGNRTHDQGFADPCLNHLATSPCCCWCRGGDLNPYALSGTAPSRRRVYLFHHLGDPLYITVFGTLCNTRWPGPKTRVRERPPAVYSFPPGGSETYRERTSLTSRWRSGRGGFFSVSG